MFNVEKIIDLMVSVGSPVTFFFGGLLEEVIAPIPSAAVMLAGGLSFADTPHTGLYFLLFLLKVALPISLGVTLGSLVFYKLGNFFGHAFVEKYGRYVGVGLRDIEKVHRLLEKGYTDDLVLLLARIFPLVPSVAICVVAGVLKWPMRSYVFLTFVGTFLRTILLGLLAWKLGVYAKVWVEKFESLEMWFTVSLGLLVLVFIFTRLMTKKKHARIQSTKNSN